MTLAFDLDGTLIAAEARQALLLRAVARRYGVEIDPKQVWQTKRSGRSNRQLLTEMALDHDMIEAVVKGWLHEVETTYWLSLDIPFADTFEVLEAVASLTGRPVLITARQNERLMRQQIMQSGLDDFFSEIYCVRPTHAAPDKAKILGKLAVKGFVGDSESDLNAAQNANVPFYGVSTGQRCKSFLISRGGQRVYSGLSEFYSNFSNVGSNDIG